VFEYVDDTPSDPWQNEIHVEKDFIVHKFAQEAMIKHILYGCMQAVEKVDYQMLGVLKKEKSAETRKAKIRGFCFQILLHQVVLVVLFVESVHIFFCFKTEGGDSTYDQTRHHQPSV
jgi:hypothetical protein